MRTGAQQYQSEFQTFPWDGVSVWCPVWDEIQGKAHMYKTARLRTTGEYVAIIGVRKFVDGLALAEPCFAIRVPGFAGYEHRTTEELCGFCL